MSRIRTNLITNRMANGAPTVSNGLVISGVTTSTTFHGDGSNLTGIDATQIVTGNTNVQTVDTGSDGHVKVTTEGTERLRINHSGKVIIGASSVSPATSYTDNLVVSEATANAGIQIVGNNSNSNFATIGLGDAGGNLRSYLEAQLGANGNFTIGTAGSGPIRFLNSGGERLRITSGGLVGFCTASPSARLHVHAPGSDLSTIRLSGTASNQVIYDIRQGVVGVNNAGFSIRDITNSVTRFVINGDGKIGINNSSPAHPLHIANTSATFNSASLIRGDNSTTGQGAYATFTNTTDSKSAYFGVDGAGLFNLDAGAALVGTNGSESIIFCTNGNTKKVSVSGGTNDRILTLHGGGELVLASYAPDTTFVNYAGYHQDNHGNQLIGLNASLNYSGTSGTHQWKQNNAHGSIGSAGIFIGGNGSDNNTAITFFRNGQGSSAGTTFAQNSWKFRISDYIQQNFGVRYQTRGYFDTNTNSQNASNAAALAGSLGYSFGYQEAYSTSGGGWAHPYPDLVVGYHTGISMGAYPNYGGIRFFTDHPSSSSTMIMSIGNGNNGVHVVNTLSKGGGSFRIAHPHPSKKYTHDLVHSFIEGPQMDLIYRGKINLVGGSATVNIDTVSNMTDGTFVLLNRDVQCFTSNETGWTAVKGSVSGNILTITAQDNSCTDTVSWMVIGERQDDKIKSLDMTDDDGNLIMEPLTIEETHM